MNTNHNYSLYQEQVKKYGNIYFSVPGWYCNYSIYRRIQEIRNTYPFIFICGIQIEAIFDCPHSCIWNGGSYTFDKVARVNELNEICSFYKNEAGIPIRLTFTNPTLEENDLFDRYGNMIAKVVSSYDGNEVLVSTELMADYMSSNYKNFKIVRSIVGTKDVSLSLDNIYSRTVLARRHNNDFDFLEKIEPDLRDKVEILCNEVCIPDCWYTYNHYAAHGVDQKCFTSNSSGCIRDEIVRDFRALNVQYRSNHLDLDDIFLRYLPMGYKHFKISPRFDSDMFIEEFTRFFIREEYQQDFRLLVRKV